MVPEDRTKAISMEAIYQYSLVYLNEKNADRREDDAEARDSAQKERFWRRYRMTKVKEYLFLSKTMKMSVSGG